MRSFSLPNEPIEIIDLLVGGAMKLVAADYLRREPERGPIRNVELYLDLDCWI